LKSKIERISDVLKRDNGVSGYITYTEQISWTLFCDVENFKAKKVF